MFSYTTLLSSILLLSLAIYVRLSNHQQERIVAKQKQIRQPKQRYQSQPTYRYNSSCFSVPSLTSDHSFEDEDYIYDASWSVSSDMPFSIPGTPPSTKNSKNPQVVFDKLVDSFRKDYLRHFGFSEYIN